MSQRPKGHALLNDNTTVIAPWIEITEQTNMTWLYAEHGVVINNVSMAMPHSGVLQAAVDSVNNIMQPDDLDGLGVYSIRASVPSPAAHVLCATLNSTQLTPFVYQLWNNGSSDTVINTTIWPSQLGYSDPYLGGTPLDDVFGWGEAYGSGNWPPVFAKLPKNYNTILNDTSATWGRDSVYLLGKGGDIDGYNNPTDGQKYALCQLKASQTPSCSTQYNASSHGGTLEAICEDDHDLLMYHRSFPTASGGNSSVSKDWPNIASEWGRSESNKGREANSPTDPDCRRLAQRWVT